MMEIKALKELILILVCPTKILLAIFPFSSTDRTVLSIATKYHPAEEGKKLLL